MRLQTSISTLILGSLTAGMLFAGCGGDTSENNITATNNATNNSSNNGTTSPGTTGTTSPGTTTQLEDITVLSVEDLTNKSATDYNENQHGLVSAKTVAKWVTDWEKNRPTGITGKLIIFQVGKAFAGQDAKHAYIKHDGVNVFTYDRTAGCTTTGDFRFDGVSNIPKPVFSGEQMDMAFGGYDIDPNNDLLLMVAGVPGDKATDGTKPGDYIAGGARMWYSLAYWGVKPQNLAILNGQASHVLNPDINTELDELTLADLFTANDLAPPGNGTHKVNEVRQDGTILQATTEDMMKLVDSPAKSFIIDARSEAEYMGDRETKKSKMEDKVCGAAHDEQCYAAFEGHIKGAKNIEYREFFIQDDISTQTIEGIEEYLDLNGNGIKDIGDSSFTYKSMADLTTILTDAGYKTGDTIYAYCRTGTRAVTTTFAASTILGLPTRLYDGSWTQWGKLAKNTDTNGKQLLEESDKWRVDVADYSENVTYNMPIEVNPLNKYEKDGMKTDAVINADKAYKE